jgi:hypothetical protein
VACPRARGGVVQAHAVVYGSVTGARSRTSRLVAEVAADPSSRRGVLAFQDGDGLWICRRGPEAWRSGRLSQVAPCDEKDAARARSCVKKGLQGKARKKEEASGDEGSVPTMRLFPW